MANTFNFGNGNWAQKTEKVLAYNAENDNYKPLPFDFDRGSTATRVNKQGLIETVGVDEPRIDFLNNTKGHLLLEPERRNSLLQSNQFDTTWTLSASIDLIGGQNGVGGSNNAWLLKRNSTGSRYIQQSLSLSSAQYSYSVYLKAESTNWAFLWAYDGSAGVQAYFDLENGVVGQIGGAALDSTNIESVGNGWYRCTLIYTHAPDLVRIYPAYSNGNISTGTDNGIYIQYAQLEAGSYATSYIPTQGSAVTRSAESCSQTPPDGVIGQTEGTVYVEFDYLNSTGERRFILQLGTGGDTIYARIESGQTLTSQILNSGSGLTSTGTSVPSGNNKLAIAYASNDAVIYLNGAFLIGTSSITIPSLNDIYVGHNSSKTQQIAGAVKDFKLYNTRLSNSELATLTTL